MEAYDDNFKEPLRSQLSEAGSILRSIAGEKPTDYRSSTFRKTAMC